MKRLVTADEMRALEAAAAGQGVSTEQLMQQAGEAVATRAAREGGKGARFIVLCGPGNNGGDGFVAATILHSLGKSVHCELVPPDAQLRGDAAKAFERLLAAGVQLGSVRLKATASDVVIDALLGTGLSRAPSGPLEEAIDRIAVWKASGAKVVSADLPSGLPSDGGRAPGKVVQADVTVALGFAKRGLALEAGASVSGRVEAWDIGLPQTLETPKSETWLTEEADVRALIVPRQLESHKGTFGHVLVIAGSAGKSGAAALCAKSALRGGAGLVTVATRPEVLPAVLAHGPELMGVALAQSGPLGLLDLNSLLEASDGKAALLLGPGLHRGDDTPRLLGALLEELETPTVLDADALNALVGHLEVLQRAKGELILTPHPGEFARLLDLDTKAVQADRVELARRFASKHQVVLVLKGARTVVATPEGAVHVNQTGNPGMATGGTGDVLGGLIAALLAQGLSPRDAAIAGVWIHGLAGDVAKEHHGERGLIAGDVVEGLGEVWRRWGR